MMIPVLQVALGGAIGAVARYLTGLLFLRLAGPGFPFGVLAVNLLGGFLMGLFVVYAAERAQTPMAPFVMTGLLGGFTTFSAFSLDVVNMIEKDQTGLAALYVTLSVAGAVAAVFLGLWAARGLWT